MYHCLIWQLSKKEKKSRESSLFLIIMAKHIITSLFYTYNDWSNICRQSQWRQKNYDGWGVYHRHVLHFHDSHTVIQARLWAAWWHSSSSSPSTIIAHLRLNKPLRRLKKMCSPNRFRVFRNSDACLKETLRVCGWIDHPRGPEAHLSNFQTHQ